MTGQRLDLSTPDSGPRANADDRAGDSSRFLGVHFACCDAYSRIYINHDRTAYAGHCPRCAKRIQIPIGPGGSDSRFFTAQ